MPFINGPDFTFLPHPQYSLSSLHLPQTTMDGPTRQPGSDPGTLVRVAEHFLRRRHFTDCQKYALQAHKTNPNFPGLAGILAVADVLLAREPAGTLTDHYAVLQLTRFSQDSDLIKERFNHLYVLLNPSDNKFPFSDEAFDLVCDAWYVLTNPLKKLDFDNALRKHLDGEQSNRNCQFAFWTVCPYCYHVYEYPRVYLDLCLLCPNEKCSKAFTCVEIDEPPAEVLMEGRYACDGFMQVGFGNGAWSPFAPLEKAKVNANGSDDTGNVVEISDDDGEVQTKSMKMEPNVKVDGGRKKKMLAKNTKKVTGTGNRVIKEGFLHPSGDEMGANGCQNEFRCGFFGGEMDAMNGGEVEFYDADDDILVSLQNGI